MGDIYNTKKSNICKKCRRRLKDDKSRELGLGPICYKKYLEEKKVFLFEMKITEQNK